MTDWLRLILMIFYAPLRGMREVRDRGALAPTAAIALLGNGLFVAYVVWAYLRSSLGLGLLSTGLSSLFQSAGSVIFVALIFVPLAIALTNAIERRASYRLFVQQEYASVASTSLYALAVAGFISLGVTLICHVSAADSYVGQRLLGAVRRQMEVEPQMQTLFDPRFLGAGSLFAGVMFLLFLLSFAVMATIALAVSLRLSWARAALVVVVVGVISVPAARFLLPVFSMILGSPFLLLLVFFLLRGYFSGIVSNQRARAAFTQNLEAATINPRDSSAHYNLGLIHHQRGELDQARERFQRAIDIDPDEVDAHYQLGRIGRAQNRLPNAIGHFEEVVQRDQSHAQNEIWREIGATYVAAGQYSDARDALQKFLDRRPNDPEGLYLIGRAHAGLGDNQEAASSMQACIEAVKTAPAYKYRTEKRWLNEAQQFLKGARRLAAGSKQ